MLSIPDGDAFLGGWHGWIQNDAVVSDVAGGGGGHTVEGASHEKLLRSRLLVHL